MSIKLWLVGKLKQAFREHDQQIPILTSGNSVTRQSLRSDGMEFTLYNADGGWVLEYHSYDHAKDESINRIHIIQDTQDFGTQLSNIITMELLRR
jgi:hypothetical protein